MKRKGLLMSGRGLLTAFAVGVLTLTAGSLTAEACTSYYAGKDVTADGSILFGRTEDIGGSHSKIFKVYEAATHEDGEMYTDVTDFTMPLPSETYRYTVCEDDPGYGGDLFGEVGTNEYGVSMTATESASPSSAIEAADPFIDSGITESSMVNAVLPCVKTAREGVEFLANILDTYGAGEGNTLMIGDANEVWYIEILSGHQYAAIKMPSDKAAIMPNCYMLETIDVTDSANVIASANLIATAKTAGTYTTGTDAENENLIHVRDSYSDGMGAGNTYRIWGGQIILNSDLQETISPTQESFDMFVTPKEKVTVQMMYQIAGTQYEGTDYEGQGRVIGTSSSCECHLFQVRSDMPTEIATIEWLAMGSADLSPFLPYYTAAITDTLPAYQLGTTVHNEDSAYWAFRSVAALSVSAESRDLAAVNVKQYWTNYVDSLVKAQETVDKKMTELYNTDPSAVSAKATNLGMAVADEAISIAKEIQSELLARIARGNGKITAIRGAGYTPTRLTKESYSSYSFDMTYEEPVVITQDTVDQLTAAADAATNEAAIAKAEAEAAQKEAAAAKAAQAELQAKLDAAGNGTPAVTTIKTNKKAYTLKKGKKVTIKVTTTNDDGKKVTFKSSKKSVAKITAKGVVKGVKKGTATITITCNGVSKKVKVTVK